LNTPSATTSARVVVPASASAISSGQNAPGTRLARWRAVSAEQDHRGDQRDDEDESVLFEDDLDHVADGGELDERADRRDGDVAFQIGVLPDRDGGG